ncbi:MAG: D-glycero-beta-D-manno-heptose 1,7-bisphosphate 7-phosphatase [Gammaproteobacteria bacterium]
MRLVILDRDGVINQDSDAYIKSPAEWIPLPGSLDAIVRLNRGGFSVVVATNQAGIGRGLFDLNTLQNIHQKMIAALAALGGHLDGIFFCPHRPDEHCDCRKPEPGLLRQVAARFDTNLNAVPVIGDSLRDLRAAQAVDARPILVLSGNGRRTSKHLPEEFRDIDIYPDLAAAATALLKEGK